MAEGTLTLSIQKSTNPNPAKVWEIPCPDLPGGLSAIVIAWTAQEAVDIVKARTDMVGLIPSNLTAADAVDISTGNLVENVANGGSIHYPNAALIDTYRNTAAFLGCWPR